jgi:hypothetical protein
LQYCDEVAASSNNGNLEITYSDNWCGQGKNKFITAVYPYAVTKFQVYSIAHKYLVVDLFLLTNLMRNSFIL